MKGSNAQRAVGRPGYEFELGLEAWQVRGAEGTKGRTTTLVHTAQLWPSATLWQDRGALRQGRWGPGPCRHLTTSVIWAHSKISRGSKRPQVQSQLPGVEARPPFTLLGLSPSLPSPSSRHSQVHQALSHGWALPHAVPCSLLQSLSEVEVNIISAVKLLPTLSPEPPHTNQPPLSG